MDLVVGEQSRVRITCHLCEGERAHGVPAALEPTVLVRLRPLPTAQSTSRLLRSTLTLEASVKDGRHKSTYSEDVMEIFFFFCLNKSFQS